jgi:hypothetical protein
MDFRGVLLVGVVLGAGALASSTACSGPDPGAITFTERAPGGTTDQSSGTSGPTGTPGGKTDGGGGGGGSDSGAVKDLIFGTSTLTWEDPGLVADAVQQHNGPVQGKDCVVAGCHLDNGKPWAFAGTVYSAAQGGTTVPKAEVRIVKPDGTEYGHAYTDANGNFWLENATPFPAGSKVGVRKEGGTRSMAMAALLQPADRGCTANRGNCHGTAGTGKVYAP